MDYTFSNYELSYSGSAQQVNLNLFIVGAFLVFEEKDAYFKTSLNFYP